MKRMPAKYNKRIMIKRNSAFLTGECLHNTLNYRYIFYSTVLLVCLLYDLRNGFLENLKV